MEREVFEVVKIKDRVEIKKKKFTEGYEKKTDPSKKEIAALIKGLLCNIAE